MKRKEKALYKDCKANLLVPSWEVLGRIWSGETKESRV